MMSDDPYFSFREIGAGLAVIIGVSSYRTGLNM